MKVFTVIGRCLDKFFYPVRTNAAFFVFMYVLGVVCSWLTLPQTGGARLYENLYLELFLDVYLGCVVLTVLPNRVRKWVQALLYVVLYAVAVVDVYCFVKFDSTLTPTMLLLVGETDSREAGEFLRSYLSADVLFSAVGWLFALIVLHVLFACRRYWLRFLSGFVPTSWRAFHSRYAAFTATIRPYGGLICVALLLWSGLSSAHNKVATWKLMTAPTIGHVEHVLTEQEHAVLYTPVSRLAFSVYANSLAAEQIDRLVVATDKARIDSCSYTSPNIVLIIGESFGKHHSQQYGYFMPTTPRQVEREKTGLLVKYTDVVSPWNLTSFVFKNVFSMHVVGQQGEWCDYPLFPVLFRKAGYHVSFLTNQFLPKAKEAVYDFSGGFFLNDPELSKAQFDTRNTQLHQFDE
ncbi:MAG TPA: sulfatase-like hydrolase/transferase, partial [Prevotella sp.]